MMGVGKSTIGKNVAKKLKLKFIDVDTAIEKNEKKTIAEIFKSDGEKYFRKIEKKISLEILQKNDAVISLGGGAFMDKSIRKEVLGSTISIWLDLNVKNLYIRLKNIKKRPLLKAEKLEETINKIYTERKKFYNQSTYKIVCDLLEIDKIVKKVIELYENPRNKI
mgnify:FL=1|tara:strand:+ start:39 stop:533 length:495 start_codon:yes stop_codon:yes gene_type:complete